jgi:hypothetical protein
MMGYAKEMKELIGETSERVREIATLKTKTEILHILNTTAEADKLKKVYEYLGVKYE